MLTYDTPATSHDMGYLIKIRSTHLLPILDLIIPPKGEGVYCFTSVRPSFQTIFRHIFLSNYWWQKSDIWSQASYLPYTNKKKPNKTVVIRKSH
jgi:hypothetical protein